MDIILQLHGLWRWVLLIAALVTAGKALIGWLGRQSWGKVDSQLGLVYTIILDLQFLGGLLLWIGGPFNLRLFATGAMSDAYQRFILVEHPFLILIALVLAHVGRTLSKKATEPAKKHRVAYIFYGLSLICVAAVFWLHP